MPDAAYQAFLEAKVPQAQRVGFDCDIEEVRSHLVDGRAMRDHVRPIVKWAVEGGRRALFEAFGLHKTMQQLEIARIVAAKAQGDGLLTAAEMAEMPVGRLPKLFAEASRRAVYDFAEHVALGETIEARAPNDDRGHLPRTFMSLAPGSHHPDVWHDVNRMRTLNTDQVAAGREKHVCPLQFDIVDRLIERFSMPGELVFDPFGGLGTVPLRALKLKRRGRSSELNDDYFRFSRMFLEQAEREMSMPTLFALLGMADEEPESEAA